MYSMYDEEEAQAQAGPRLLTQTPAAQSGEEKEEKVLPLPRWLLAVYFVFPIILYIPDAIFNYFVYSDGVNVPAGDNVMLNLAQIALWGFLSIGVVGMAYLLSVLAPWHWMQGHKVQAFFCGLGVLIATAITTWNSLAFRSTSFQPFKTDLWAYSVWPQLTGISITMILAAVAPPFWGLFWAIVQPTQNRRDLSHLQGSHQERMLRLQQDAELKAARAEANAKVRSAQLQGLAQTAAAAREQAGAAFRKKSDDTPQAPDVVQAPAATPAPAPAVVEVEEAPDSGMRLRPLPQDYSLPGSLPAARRAVQPAPRAEADERPIIGRPVARATAASREPSVADPIAAQGMTPAEVTDPMSRLARAAQVMQPPSAADVPPASRTRGRARGNTAD